jgi:hypothetical protein
MRLLAPCLGGGVVDHRLTEAEEVRRDRPHA